MGNGGLPLEAEALRGEGVCGGFGGGVGGAAGKIALQLFCFRNVDRGGGGGGAGGFETE